MKIIFLHSRLTFTLLLMGLTAMMGWVYLHMNTRITEDSLFYDKTTRSILAGQGLAMEHGKQWLVLSQHTPGYQLFLAPIYAVFDTGGGLLSSSIRVLAAILIQNAVGLISFGVWWWLFSQLDRRKLSQVTFGLLWILYIPIHVSHNLLLGESITFLVLGVVSVWFWRLIDRKQIWSMIWPGMMLGMAALFRAQVMILAIAHGLWLVFYDLIETKLRLKQGLVVLLGFVLVSGVWSVRSYRISGELMYLEQGLGSIVRNSFCSIYGCGAIEPKAELSIEGTKAISEPSRLAYQLGWWYLVRQPRLMLERPFGLEYVVFSENVYIQANSIRVLMWVQVMVMLFFIVGVVFSYRKKHILRWWVFWVLGMVVGLVIVWPQPRYLFVVMPLILGLAAFGVTSSVNWLRKRGEKLAGMSLRQQRLFWIGVSGLLLFGCVVLLPYEGSFEGSWWQFERLSSWVFFGLLGIFLMASLFWKVDYSRIGKLVVGMSWLVLWGMVIALWPSLRWLLLPQAPENDFTFPVAMWLGQVFL